MASLSQWIEGARPRTLPLTISPVLMGTGLAVVQGSFHPVHAALALVVGLSIQVGVNFANDYSDGVRGTDAHRVGPQRLVGSGAAAPRVVKRAAFAAFGVAGLAGCALVALSGLWWLLAVGVAAVAAAWFYTGGTHPYGYLGLGEAFVFVFFGLVATAGTSYTQTGRMDVPALVAGAAQGFGACAVLMANNLRDIPTDAAAGKRTLAVRLGDTRARAVFTAFCVLAVAGLVAVAALTTWWGLLGLALLPGMAAAVRAVAAGRTGFALIPVLKHVGLAQLVGAAGYLAGCAVAIALA